jgi:hypothetical protein
MAEIERPGASLVVVASDRVEAGRVECNPADFARVAGAIGAGGNIPMKSGPMNRAELLQILETTGRSGRWLASAIGLSHTHVLRLGAGKYPVPDQVAAWLRACERICLLHPLPAPPDMESELVE